MQKKSKSLGFTLLEILLVVGIIAVLAGIVIVAINPSKQLATVRNTERKSNLAEINKAMQQYYIDNSFYPAGTPTALTEICDTGSHSYPSGVDCGTLVDLSALVPTYLVAIPTDPQGPVAFFDKLISTAFAAEPVGTGYMIGRNSSNNKIFMSAPNSELNERIAIGRMVCSPTLTEWYGYDTPSGEYANWYNASTTCANLQGGLACWRLPSVNELESKYNETHTTPLGFQSDNYWSSITYPGYEDVAFIFDMSSGITNENNKNDAFDLVRCVR